MDDRSVYYYEGPVLMFGNVVQNKWHGETTAVSIGKARSNLIYQWKIANGKTAGSKVELPGKIILVR